MLNENIMQLDWHLKKSFLEIYCYIIILAYIVNCVGFHISSALDHFPRTKISETVCQLMKQLSYGHQAQEADCKRSQHDHSVTCRAIKLIASPPTLYHNYLRAINLQYSWFQFLHSICHVLSSSPNTDVLYKYTDLGHLHMTYK